MKRAIRVGDRVRIRPLKGEAEDGRSYVVVAIQKLRPTHPFKVAWLENRVGCVSLRRLELAGDTRRPLRWTKQGVADE